MILGFHIVITAYGFWLPNDPRGSWSDDVWARHLRPFGLATKVRTRRSLAWREHDQLIRRAAVEALKRPAVEFSGLQCRAIGRGFAEAVKSRSYPILACSLLSKHAHLVIAHHEMPVERIVAHLKARANAALVAEGSHPFEDSRNRHGDRPSPWTESFWQVYLTSTEHVRRAIAYVEQNPLKESKPKQKWSFVTKREFSS